MTEATPEKTGAATPFVLEFTLQAADFQDEWQRCNMLANYIAEYTAYQFDQRERAENLISTITNELLETAVSLTTKESPVTINVLQDEKGLHVDATYQVKSDLLSDYQVFIRQLDGKNFDQYQDLLTAQNERETDFNQLGLAMLSHDFGAQMTVVPEEDSGETCTKITVPNEEFSE